MTREQAEQIARNHLGYGWAPLWAIDAIMEAAAVEREACAKPLDESAARLLAPKRTNEVDRHVADVLQRHAKAIRARGE